MIVGPTKSKPRIFRSLLIFPDISVLVDIWDKSSQLFWMGFPSRNPYRYASKLPNCSCTFEKALALWITELIFCRLQVNQRSEQLLNRRLPVRCLPGHVKIVECSQVNFLFAQDSVQLTPARAPSNATNQR